MLQNKFRSIKNIKELGKDLLKDSPTKSLDSELILSNILRYPKEYLFTHPEESLTEGQIIQYLNLIGKRAKGYPLAYLISYKEFYGNQFKVNRNVLIPRPETEGLIDIALDIIDKNKLIQDICDLGTGSGCIGISLLKEIKADNVNMDLYDIDKKCLELARINSRNILNKDKQKRINLIELDYRKLRLKRKYNMIIANPPYLNNKEMHLIQKTPVRFEPYLSLYGGKDGLDYYRSINKIIFSHLNKNGFAVIEIGSNKLNEYLDIFKSHKVVFIKDLSNSYRYLIISRL